MSQRIRRPPLKFVDALREPLYVLLYFPVDRTHNIYPTNSHLLHQDGTAITAPLKTAITVTCMNEQFEAIICARCKYLTIYSLYLNYIIILLSPSSNKWLCTTYRVTAGPGKPGNPGKVLKSQNESWKSWKISLKSWKNSNAFIMMKFAFETILNFLLIITSSVQNESVQC
jgi:hypothetical protein